MIYEPREDSFLLEKEVNKHAFGKVLDMGTGSGILAFAAAKLKKVKSILAADISNDSVNYLKNKIKEESQRKDTENRKGAKEGKKAEKRKETAKIKAVKSSLFSNIKGRFDTIIFNPPYLPRDKRESKDSSLATTGGKHGYEVLIGFLSELNDYLTFKGFALILFSSLTKKDKIDEVINDIGYEAEELSSKKIAFEVLYVYLLKRNRLFNELFSKKITNIRKLMKGHRGMVYTGLLNNKKTAIKAQRKDIAAKNTVNKEALIIKKLNKYKIAPKILFKGNDYFAYEFIKGEFIIDFLENSKKKETKKVLLEVLRQCRVLDKLKITKEEMHNPYKHIIINEKITLVDFERAHYDLKPKNITQFMQYIMRNQRLLSEKGIKFNKNDLIELGKQYKNKQTNENYNKIKKFIQAL